MYDLALSVEKKSTDKKNALPTVQTENSLTSAVQEQSGCF